MDYNFFISPEDLHQLMKWRSSDGILSIYMDIKAEGGITPSRWKAEINSGLSEVNNRYPNDKGMQKIIHKAHEDLMGFPQEFRKRGLIYFRSSDGKIFYRSVNLPIPNKFTYMSTPYLRPIMAIIDKSPITGVAVLSQDLARVLTWRQGVIEDEGKSFTMEIEEESPGERRSAGTPTLTDIYQQKIATQLKRKMGEVARETEEMAVKNNWEQIILIGPVKYTDIFEEELNSLWKSRVVGIFDKNYINAPLHKIEEATTQLLLDWKEKVEEKEVENLINSSHPGGKGVLGGQETLDMLEQFRVSRFYFSSDIQVRGYREQDGTYFIDLTPEEAQGLEEEPYMLERMLEMAFESGSRIIPLEGRGAELLKNQGGIGASLRY